MLRAVEEGQDDILEWMVQLPKHNAPVEFEAKQLHTFVKYLMAATFGEQGFRDLVSPITIFNRFQNTDTTKLGTVTKADYIILLDRVNSFRKNI